MPQSRHRKSTKAKKRPKGRSPATAAPPLGSKNRSLRILAIVVVAVLALSAVGYVLSRRGDHSGNEVTTASGLKYVDLVEGTGATPQSGQTISVNYLGTLENGTKFDSSYDSGRPFQFIIGTGSVIKGWDEGLMSMKVGGKRKLIIPPALGYGPRGSPPKIPGNSTLVFEVELLSVK
ncbi:MAG: FKBP-type peptidyl-prolyl cis-trans isomerase [Pyrinomonadaceae bacterium]